MAVVLRAHDFCIIRNQTTIRAAAVRVLLPKTQ
jgi:hypothetical protein